MPHLEYFAESVAALNAFVFPRAVRRYQLDIVKGGCFHLISPCSGARVEPTSCHLFNLGDAAHGNIGIAYRLLSPAPLWLLAASVKDGFPIVEVYDPVADDTLWLLGQVHARENIPWRRQLRRLELAAADVPMPVVGAGKVSVLMGHPNFAHHLWNELPALYAIAESGDFASRALDITTIYEPLLPIANIAESLDVTLRRVLCFDQVSGFQSEMVTRLGSTQISGSLRKKIVRMVQQRASNHLQSLLQNCSPVFWLSLRLDARTADNQCEFISALITRLSAYYPLAGFFLDGFSYPDDFGHPVYGLGGDQQQGAPGVNERLAGASLAAAMRSRESDISAAINTLRQQLPAALMDSVINVSGMSLTDAVFLAGKADYYVCHTGTLQHKIAWLHNKPGVVHANTVGLQAGAASWLADQLQGGLVPTLIAQHLVADLETIRSKNQVSRNCDYHFLDVDAVVDEILVDIAENLEVSPS